MRVWQAYSWSGEVNYLVNDTKSVIKAVLDHYAEQIPKLDTTDDINSEFADWRMPLRSSNTELL